MKTEENVLTAWKTQLVTYIRNQKEGDLVTLHSSETICTVEQMAKPTFMGKLKLQQKFLREEVLQEFRNLEPKRKVICAKYQNLDPKRTLLIMKSKLCDDNLNDTLASFCPLAAKREAAP